MKSNTTSSNKKYILLLVGVLLAAIASAFFLHGKVDLTTLGKVEKHPVDTEENLAYGERYHPSSEHILERDRIVIKNFGTELRAQDLETGICVDAANIKEKSSEKIQRFSEYAGYFYMYDGKDLYRAEVNNPEKIRTTVKDCQEFEPMGDYIYSLKAYNGQSRLFRCSITGTYEKMLFKDEIEEFHASDGNLFMKLSEGTWRWYHVISQNTLEHHLPEHAHDISLDGNQIFYLVEENGSSVLHRRACDSGEDTSFFFLSVSGYCAANGNVGLLLQEADGSFRAAWCRADGSSAVTFEREWQPGKYSADITGTHLYITEEDGKTWATPLDHEEWVLLFDDEGNG